MNFHHNCLILLFASSYSMLVEAQETTISKKKMVPAAQTIASDMKVEDTNKVKSNTRIYSNPEGRKIEIDQQGVQSLTIPKLHKVEEIKVIDKNSDK
jgi:hypothetical protein